MKAKQQLRCTLDLHDSSLQARESALAIVEELFALYQTTAKPTCVTPVEKLYAPFTKNEILFTPGNGNQISIAVNLIDKDVLERDFLTLADDLAEVCTKPTVLEVVDYAASDPAKAVQPYWIGRNAGERRLAESRYAVQRMREVIGDQLWEHTSSDYEDLAQMLYQARTLERENEPIKIAATAIRDIKSGVPLERVTSTRGQGADLLLAQLVDHLDRRGFLSRDELGAFVPHLPAHKRLDYMVEALKKAYPAADLSFGYIGNVYHDGRDDRSWRVFGKDAEGRSVSWGYSDTENLDHMADRAQTELETWVRSALDLDVIDCNSPSFGA